MLAVAPFLLNLIQQQRAVIPRLKTLSLGAEGFNWLDGVGLGL
jgi:hypothetical protein